MEDIKKTVLSRWRRFGQRENPTPFRIAGSVAAWFVYAGMVDNYL